ncbi:DUF397 domain-containing protein [Streptomyces hainanensis]|uniref:DUF397 domain-containing protein n=1 Tax=Streptomyces hainanensis TaxID=402648 RepID=A0A4R4TY41_9ACTN|nr:DUF397 domain-containing protein [Streptomyces hainanensis]TDC80193.1 DUF397 domain-containing protein [Streptomyces hainanensis]
MSNEASELAWFKSSYSDNEGGACVEVATCADAVHVRDSKLADGPRFSTSPTTWSAFLTYASTR